MATDTEAASTSAAAATPAQSTTLEKVASLYVGDLNPEVTESILFDKFSAIGKVLSIRVCRHLTTNASLRYAYVNFQNSEDAVKAMEDLNFVEVLGEPMRIMWSQRDPTLRKTGVGNIYIKNLDANISTKDIYDTFSTFGSILSCKVATKNGVSRGFGFVHFDSPEAAKRAIDKVNGMMLSDKKLFVGDFIPRAERIRLASQQPLTFNNLYVKNFPGSYNSEDLRELFEHCGAILSYTVVTDSEGRSRCFGFVSFSNHEDAKNAITEMNGKVIEEKAIYVGRAEKKSERQLKFQRSNLYIKNLHESITDEELKEEFERFGEITSAKVMRGQDGRSRGFGFVCFSDADSAGKAITGMNAKLKNGKLLYVAIAQPKGERIQFLSAQFQQRLAALKMVKHGQPLNGGAAYNRGQHYPPMPLSQPPPYFSNLPPHMANMVAPPQNQNQRWYPAPQMRQFMSQPVLNENGQNFRSNTRGQYGTYHSRMPFNANHNNYSHRNGQYGYNNGQSYGQNTDYNNNNSYNPSYNTRMYSRAYQQGAMHSQSHNQLFVPNPAYFNGPPGIPTAPALPITSNAVRSRNIGAGESSSSEKTSPASSARGDPDRQLSPEATPFVPANGSQTTDQSAPESDSGVSNGGSGATSQPTTASTYPSSQMILQPLLDSKQVLGERLFPLIHGRQPIFAGKVTGMLLEMENSIIERLLVDMEFLEAHISEALTTLGMELGSCSSSGEN